MLKERGVPLVTIFDEPDYSSDPASQEAPIRELLPLFNLTTAANLFPDYAVGYRGDTWGVATDSRVSGRTRQVIWLLTQLIGLQRTAKEPPGTIAVDIVNAPIP